jgi:hypothetical protein
MPNELPSYVVFGMTVVVIAAVYFLFFTEDNDVAKDHRKENAKAPATETEQKKKKKVLGGPYSKFVLFMCYFEFFIFDLGKKSLFTINATMHGLFWMIKFTMLRPT